MKHPVLVAVFLAIAVLTVLACCAALLLMRSPLARLHYLGPVSLVAPLFVTAAVLTEEGLGQAGAKAIMIFLLLALQGPVVAHILGRAIAVRQGAVAPRNQ